MRTIIAGSRAGVCETDVFDAMTWCPWRPSVVLSGTAAGADRCGERWAAANRVPVERFPPDWAKHGRRAGFMRNTEMADRAEALVAIWDGQSRGTKHMIDTARAQGLRVYLWRPAACR